MYRNQATKALLKIKNQKKMSKANYLYLKLHTEESMQRAYDVIENDGCFLAEVNDKTCITFEVEDQDDADATERAINEILIEASFDDGYSFESEINEDEDED